MPALSLRSIVCASVAMALATPALAQTPPAPPPLPEQADVAALPGGHDQVAAYEQARADWLSECRRNHGNGNMVGGAVVGGLVGGLIGNRVAGRGNRTLGTIAGAAVGAAAGGAIGSSADKRAARDYCETYLERHTGYGYGQAGYGYGYPAQGYMMQPVIMMVPVAMMPMAQTGKPEDQRKCEETVVTEEWVDVPAQRIIPRPPRRVPDKRVRVN